MDFWITIKSLISRHSEFVTSMSLFFGFLGIVLAVVFYRTSRPTRRISYATRTFRVISEKAQKIPGLEVRFAGQLVKTLSITRVAIWNAGSEPVRNTDIPTDEPLVIHPRDGVQVLDAGLIESTSKANKPSIRPTEESPARDYVFDFRFLNPGDGAIMSFIHDGVDVDDLIVTGTLIGGRIKRTTADPETVAITAGPHAASTMVCVESGRSLYRFFPLFIYIMSIVMICVALIIGNGELLFTSIALLPLGLGCQLYLRKTYPPRHLRMYDDNL